MAARANKGRAVVNTIMSFFRYFILYVFVNELAIGANKQALLEVTLSKGISTYQGELQVLQVDILTPTWFSRAPQLPALKIPNVVVIQPHSFATNFTLKRGGQQFTAQRYEYWLYPQYAGLVVIPPFNVLAWPAGSSHGQSLESLSIVFQTDVIPNAAINSLILVTDKVKLTETYHYPQGDLLSGSGITRDVHVSSHNVPGSLFPDLYSERLTSQKYGVYQSEPKLFDQSDREGFIGHRKEQYTYLLSESGEVTLPALNIRWWNATDNAWHVASLPAKTLQVLPSAGYSSAALDKWPLWGRFNMLIGVGLFICLLLGSLLWFKKRNQRASLLVQKKVHSERALRAQIKRAIKQQSLAEIIKNFYVWLDAQPSSRTVIANNFTRRSVAKPDVLAQVIFAQYAKPNNKNCMPAVDFRSLTRQINKEIKIRAGQSDLKDNHALPPLYIKD